MNMTTIRRTLAGATLLGLAACGSATHLGSGPAGGPQQAITTSPPTPVASPNGTFKGACDYTLGDNPASDPSTAVATGDIEVSNTGNIGLIATVTITWPQQGYNPLTQTKTGVQVAAGQTNDVQFNLPLTSTQLDNLQNWQLGHMGDTGCTYNGTITGTYGSAS